MRVCVSPNVVVVMKSILAAAELCSIEGSAAVAMSALSAMEADVLQ